MPKTHSQPKAKNRHGSSTKRQPRAKGKGSPKGHLKALRAYKLGRGGY